MPFAPGPPVPKNTCHGSAWSTGEDRPAKTEIRRSGDDGVSFIAEWPSTCGAVATRPKPETGPKCHEDGTARGVYRGRTSKSARIQTDGV